jgi:hypothetical protein
MAAAAVLLVSAGADAQSIEGKWAVEYPTRIAAKNGEQHVEATGKATLTIERLGADSISGSWHSLNVQDTTKTNPPRRIVGTVAANKLVFVGAPVEAKIRRGTGSGVPEEFTIVMRSYFEGTINGDTIEGTMYSKSEDETITSSPSKWSAKRIVGS